MWLANICIHVSTVEKTMNNNGVNWRTQLRQRSDNSISDTLNSVTKCLEADAANNEPKRENKDLILTFNPNEMLRHNLNWAVQDMLDITILHLFFVVGHWADV